MIHVWVSQFPDFQDSYTVLPRRFQIQRFEDLFYFPKQISTNLEKKSIVLTSLIVSLATLFDK